MTDLDARIAAAQERNALSSASGRITEADREELRDLYAERDRALAQALLDAALGGDDVALEAESAIIERLDISPDETEQGLTRSAVERIEAFVSDSLGRPWTYEDSGMLGVTAVNWPRAV